MRLYLMLKGPEVNDAALERLRGYIHSLMAVKKVVSVRYILDRRVA